MKKRLGNTRIIFASRITGIVSFALFLSLFFLRHLVYEIYMPFFWLSLLSFLVLLAAVRLKSAGKLVLAFLPLAVLAIVEIPWSVSSYLGDYGLERFRLLFPSQHWYQGPPDGTSGPDRGSSQARLRQVIVDEAYRRLLADLTVLDDGFRALVYAKNFRTPYVTTNSLGFRAPEFTPKWQNVFRIVFMGGSGAFGYQAVSDDSIASSQLQEMLNERWRQAGDRIRFEVINLALPAGTSTLDYPLFATYAQELNPDLVVFLTGSNDLSGATLRVQGISNLATRALDGRLSEAACASIVRRHARKVNILRVVFDSFSEPGWFGDPTADPGLTQQHYDRWREDYFRNMEKIYRLARKLGVEVVTVQQPTLHVALTVKRKLTDADREMLRDGEQGNPLWFENVVRRYSQVVEVGKRIAGRYGYSYYPLTSIFESYEAALFQESPFVQMDPYGRTAPLYVSKSHWTAAGNRLVAEGVLQLIAPHIRRRIDARG